MLNIKKSNSKGFNKLLMLKSIRIENHSFIETHNPLHDDQDTNDQIKQMIRKVEMNVEPIIKLIRESAVLRHLTIYSNQFSREQIKQLKQVWTQFNKKSFSHHSPIQSSLFIDRSIHSISC